MTVNIRATEATTTAEPLDILALYRTMVTARVMNDLLKVRKTQGKFPFYIGCAGHESMAAVTAALNPDDWLSLYYRDLAAWLQRTGDITGPCAKHTRAPAGQWARAATCPRTTAASATASCPPSAKWARLAPFAGGVAFALQREKRNEIIMFTTGDGGAATNDFNALFRQAAVHQLPILIVVEDNGWAITTASPIQWGGSLVDWARGGGVYAEEVDGTDAMATYQASARLVEHVRSGKGPVLMHLRLGLLDPHSSSTDIKSYRTKEEIEPTAATKDPVKNFGRWLVEQGYLQEGDIERIRKEMRAEMERAESVRCCRNQNQRQSASCSTSSISRPG